MIQTHTPSNDHFFAEGEFAALIENHPVIHHPFLEDFSSGRVGMEEVRTWASQQYFHLLTLPNCFASLYARIPLPLWKEKQGLVRVLQGEVPHSPSRASHYSLFEALSSFLQIDLDALRKNGPAPYTARFVERRMELCHSSHYPVEMGLAAIGWGNEIVNLHLFEHYRKGFEIIPGLKKAPREYILAHLEEEGPDSLVFQGLLNRMIEEGASYSAMREGIQFLLDWRMDYFDGLQGTR